jgi:hypothetical protein
MRAVNCEKIKCGGKAKTSDKIINCRKIQIAGAPR